MTTYELMRQQAHTERQRDGALDWAEATLGIGVRQVQGLAAENDRLRTALRDIAATATACAVCAPGDCGKCDTLRTIGDRADAALAQEADDE